MVPTCHGLMNFLWHRALCDYVTMAKELPQRFKTAPGFQQLTAVYVPWRISRSLGAASWWSIMKLAGELLAECETLGCPKLDEHVPRIRTTPAHLIATIYTCIYMYYILYMYAYIYAYIYIHTYMYICNPMYIHISRYVSHWESLWVNVLGVVFSWHFCQKKVIQTCMSWASLTSRLPVWQALAASLGLSHLCCRRYRLVCFHKASRASCEGRGKAWGSACGWIFELMLLG